MEHYTIGLDFGSLSGRGVLVETGNGAIVAQCECVYPHGILDAQLPDGAPLDCDWALQNPMDYLTVLECVIPSLLDQAGVAAESVIGLGLDFTASTLIPLAADGSPLSQNPAFATVPHAWCKLWKHHAAICEAEELTAAASHLMPELLIRCGGRISPESLFPKLLQVYREAPGVYAAAHSFAEAGDWVVQQLTGQSVRSGTLACCKGLWDTETGYPPKELLTAVEPGFADSCRSKLLPDDLSERGMIFPGAAAGVISPQAAEHLGLSTQTVVTPSHSDAHVGVAAVGITEPGSALLIVGTSLGIIWQDTVLRTIPGVCSAVRHCDYPEMVGYAAGQCSVGDCFRWFVDRCLPGQYHHDAKRAGLDSYGYLESLAAALEPGQSGLLALDWWNGNRSCLLDSELSGMLVGLTLQTKPEEIYRALLEAVALGTRKIIETVEQHGRRLEEIHVSGGIALKSPLLMQIYADVLGRPIRVSSCEQVPALGSAIFAAAAAGARYGGWESIFEASRQMCWKDSLLYIPCAQATAAYALLFDEYKRLHDYFGQGENQVMKHLRSLRLRPNKNLKP